MLVRQGKAPPIRKMPGGQPTPKRPAQGYPFPAPVNGWVLNENLATPVPASARVLDNWICTEEGVRVRGGALLQATVGAAVTYLFKYSFGAAEELYATTASGLFDVSAPADPEVAEAAVISGFTSGEFTAFQFGTTGGEFLFLMNGVDTIRRYDGSTWSAVADITGVTLTTLSQGWSHANRAWFVGEDLNAYYLPVQSISGAATQFSLASVFDNGGSLLLGARWSIDSGDGLDDKCVFVTDEGEVAIYSGTDPANAATWALEGVYEIPKPLGKNAWVQAGGDLMIATEVGLVSLASARERDLAALGAQAVSRNIAPYWRARAQEFSGWQMKKVPEIGQMIVSQPKATGTDAMLLVNLNTGAWCRATGWDAQAVGEFLGNPMFGTAGGEVYRADEGGQDGDAIYTARCLWQADSLGLPGVTKTAKQARPVFQTATPINPQVNVRSNFDETQSAPPSAAVTPITGDLWDSATWDQAVWDSGKSTAVNDAQWRAVAGVGHVLAPELQLTFGSAQTPDVELVSLDLMFAPGETVT